MDCRVITDFVGQKPGELTLKAGDVITNAELTGDIGWFKGTLNGYTGRFPASFVHVFENTTNGGSDTQVFAPTSTTSLDDQNIYEDLQCPICFEIPEEKIYQCTNGHTICLKCSVSVTVCPQCRSNLKVKGQLIRNRVLESLVSKITITCPFTAEGCIIRTMKSQISLHKAGCAYNPNIVQLCRFFGYKCNFWSDVLSPDRNFDHLKNHKAMLHCADSVILHYTCFNAAANQNIMESRNENFRLWIPIILKTSFECSFLLVSKTWKHDQFQLMTWSCVQLNNFDHQFEVEFVVMNPNPNARTLRWLETPVKMLELKLEDSPFGFPVSNLENSYTDENNNLAVLVAIRRNPGTQNGVNRSTPKRIMLGNSE